MTKFEDVMAKKNYTIYRMWHENTPGIRYVGITTMPLLNRLLGHLSDANQNINRTRSNYGNGGANNHAKCEWIASLILKGLCPHIDELDSLYGTPAEARALEDHWINYYLGEPQYTLLNAKLPKQAQAVAKGVEQPVSDTIHHESKTNRAANGSSNDTNVAYNNIINDQDFPYLNWNGRSIVQSNSATKRNIGA